MKKYHGLIPPCAIFCGTCPKYLRKENNCPGAGKHCKDIECEIFKCCIDKNKKQFCYECGDFPCSQFRKFSEKSILKYENDLIKEQKILKKIGSKKWLELKNSKNNE